MCGALTVDAVVITCAVVAVPVLVHLLAARATKAAADHHEDTAGVVVVASAACVAVSCYGLR